MKKQIITIVISVILSSIVSVFFAPTVNRFGASIIETESSDTLNTFRTNVNTSLNSLLNDRVSTTTAYTWTQAQSFLGELSVGATATTTITTTGKVGIGSTTPLGNIGIGTASATSSISGGNLCWYFQDEADRGMWIKLATSGSQVFSTSTTSCL